ncbi:ABC transporter permease [Tepidimonas sp.]|uniref:ABC transporter permease n=3 Tax=Tepidimonas sp. TaxID=2002775 RepID=UPI002FDFC8C4
MKAIWLLALHSAKARRVNLSITVMALALSSAMLLAVERVRSDARASFTQAVSGVDLVVGARTGSIQLVLYAVFRIGAATHNMRWDSYTALAEHPAVAWAVPISLGDNHRGFPVVGTTPAYFERLRYGDGRPLALAAGRPFTGSGDGLFEAVLGHEVARRLGYRLGEAIVLSHGMQDWGPQHGDKPFTVVGILAPTGTPVDRSVHISLPAMNALHLDWVGGAPLPGVSIPPELLRSWELQPKEITAVFVGLHQRSDVFRLQRHLHQWPHEPLLAAMPGIALDELWQVWTQVERALWAMSALAVLVGLSGMGATLLAGLEQRRREWAILRSLGAGPREIGVLVLLEGALVVMAGLAAGLLLLTLSAAAFAPLVQAHWGLVLSARLPSAHEWALLGLLLAIGLLASAAPAWRAWRHTLADGLTPR